MSRPAILRGKRILLVDDEQSIRDAYAMLLGTDDHQVIPAADASQALDLFRAGQFDLVITDFEMPGMKGNELAVKIKSLSPFQRLLMITAHPKQPDSLTNPVDHVLNKPFTFEDLRAAIAKVFA
jgi:DNA-binding response OmpR family regulator